MTGFGTIVHNITLLAVLMAIGFVSVRTGYLGKEVKASLSKVIVRITLPLLILNALTSIELTMARLQNAGIVVLIALGSILLLYALGGLAAKLFHMPLETAVIHRAMTAFGNVAFLGFPVIKALFGGEGLFYAAVYQFVNDVFVWSFLLCQLNAIGKKGKITASQTLKNILNPCMIAFIISFVMMLFGWKFTGFVFEITNGLGSMTTYLSMLFIGCTLAEVDLTHLKSAGRVFAIVFLKMLLVPILLVFVTRFLPLSDAARGAAILQVAVPSQTIVAVLTQEYGGDTVYTSECILITTIAGLVTMPVVYYIMTL